MEPGGLAVGWMNQVSCCRHTVSLTLDKCHTFTDSGSPADTGKASAGEISDVGAG